MLHSALNRSIYRTESFCIVFTVYLTSLCIVFRSYRSPHWQREASWSYFSMFSMGSISLTSNVAWMLRQSCTVVGWQEGHLACENSHSATTALH